MKNVFILLSALLLVQAKGFSDTCSCERGQLSLSVDFLYWKAKQPGIGFTTDPLRVFTTTDFTDSPTVSPDYDWKPGFRINAAYTFADSCWTAGLRYTQYNGAAHGRQLTKDDEGIFPTLSFSPETFPTDYITSARTCLRLNTYLLDVVTGYDVCLNDCLTVVPTLSLRNVWITQKIKANYLGATFNAGSDKISLHSKFYGLGPRVGIRPIVSLGCGFNLYGEAAGSLLFGWFDVHQRETFLNEPRSHLCKNPKGVRWNADATVGLNWSYCTEGCFAVKEYFIDIGFDYLYFSKQRAFEHGSEFTLSGKSEYLMLYGVHVSAELKF